MRRVLKTKVLAWLLASALVLPLLPDVTLKALAADHTYYINYGSITIAQNAGDASMLNVTYCTSPGAWATDTISADDHIVITMTTGIAPYQITVSSGKANITLRQVRISAYHKCPFSISSGATVHLTLSGANALQMLENDYANAGIHVPNGAALIIDKETSDTNDSLYVKGDSYCAGIGGRSGESCGTVIINGGTVTATNYQFGAGIGGGYNGGGGMVTINGGNVTAYSNTHGAGIGGGVRGNGGTTTINGGTVTATGKTGGAGIGGGGPYLSYPGGSGGTTTITGGTVMAYGSTNGTTYSPGIGGGINCTNQSTLIIDVPQPDAVIDFGYGGSITGSGPYTITAIGGYVIDSLKVDGIAVPDATGQASYEIIAVSKSLVATFAYTVNFTEPANGSLTVASAGGNFASGQMIRGGQQLAITAVPDAGYVLERLTVNGEDVTGEYDHGYTYTVGTKGGYRTLASDRDAGTQGAQITASFKLENALIGITPPAAITGLCSGTAKTAFALGLPATVTLVATEGSTPASVMWDVASCTYDPGSTAGQAFTVNGTVILPVGVVNPNNLPLTTSISVSVDAAVPTPVTWQTAVADGALDTVTSTKIDLTFDADITGLTADGITIANGIGSVVKGGLTGGGTSWSISLSSVTTQGNVSVAVASPAGYALSGSPKTVVVYKAIEPSLTPPSITTSALDDGTAGLPYSQTLAATGDTPVTWTVEAGSLPGGMTLSAEGILSGTPAGTGTYNFVVRAANSAGSDARALSITIHPATYTITATVGSGGTISPGGSVSVARGGSQTFTIVPDTGYTVGSVTVDGINQGPVSSYTFTGVIADHTIHASFTALGDDMSFGVRETEASSIFISAEGLFRPSAKLNAVPLSDGDSSREDLKALLIGKEAVAAFEISIDPEDAFRPPLNVSFQIGERYNGRTVYILHRLHNGNVEQFTVPVSNGEAVITIQELSPFLIAADPWITITSQPQDATVVTGQTATFSVTAQGAVLLSYQWQKKAGPKAAWEDIPGAVNPEHTTSQTNLGNSGFGYRVVITDALSNSVTSDNATLTVIKAPEPPDTGDQSRPVLYAALMILFLSLAIMLLRKRKVA